MLREGLCFLGGCIRDLSKARVPFWLVPINNKDYRLYIVTVV